MSTAAERVQECYRTVTTVFGAGGSMYNGGHRGADYRSFDGEAIIAWDDMVIESIDYGSGLGQSLGVRCLSVGGYAGWAHVKGIVGGVGTVVPYGSTLAYTAGWGDAHGTLWTGPHIHTTRGFISAFNCSVGIRPLTDPVPAINAAKAGSSTAGGGVTPLPKPPAPIEEDEEPMNTVIYWTRSSDGQVVYALINPQSGYVSQWIGSDTAYNNRFAAAFRTGNFLPVTESHSRNLIASALDVAPTDDLAVRVETVDVSREPLPAI